jgi:site-specific recombinase XerD
MDKQKLSKNRHTAIDVLIEDAMMYLRETMVLSQGTTATFYKIWKQLIPYMKDRNIPYYTPEVGERFISFRYQDMGIAFSESWGSRISLEIRRLEEFYLTGKMYKKEKFSPSFESEIGTSVIMFINERASQNRFSTYTLQHIRYYLSLFVDYSNRFNINKISEIEANNITVFLDSLDKTKRSLRYYVIRNMQLYLSYLHEKGLTTLNLSRLLRTDAYRNTPRVPSVYTKDEIMKLCCSVDRANPRGKRNYAILMLLSRYGLRTSDICNLKFENILWSDCLIVLTQYKTKEKVELPLTQEVGSAIIDYIKHGRPQKDHPYIFLNGISPFEPVGPALINIIVRQAFRQAKVDTTARKHGPHSLRHSLASLLLKEKVVLPVITGILGHKNSENTKDYLRVDIENLKHCALDVPPVASGFYNQKGGMFYE